jgi:hypothetical protein
MARGGRFDVASPNETPPPSESSRAPRAGLRLMIIIVLALAFVALYANVQKARRDKIEKVTIIPISPSPSVSSSPAD